MIVIKRVGVLQLAKIMGLIYLLMSAIFCLPVGVIVILMGVVQGEHRIMGGVIGGIGILFLPVLHGVGGFIGGAIMAVIYNGVASVAGGIELELEQ